MKRIFIVTIAIIFTIVCVPATTYAATICKTVTNKHLIAIPEDPIFITVVVKVNDSYYGTYTDKKNKRTFTKYSETATFSSSNDSYLTSQLHTSIGFLQFSNSSKKM